jgi:membrane protein DedA with SNARE-associated domain
MITLDGVIALIQTHGLLLLAPLSVLEGPIVTVIAGYLASLGLLPAAGALAVVVAGDLVGDALLYLAGRKGIKRMPQRWRDRLGLKPERIEALSDHFGARGGRTLVIGKLTHSAGAAILVAAGAARMPPAAFLWWNFVATLPKSAAFLGLGYAFGAAYAQIDAWIFRVSLVLLVALAAGGVVWWRRRRMPR